uniref:ATP-dependent DNA helicase n=1 Tax=Octopus bimaculoides TaxID=37653 RepID=A0A0L8HBE9_OCTBM
MLLYVYVCHICAYIHATKPKTFSFISTNKGRKRKLLLFMLKKTHFSDAQMCNISKLSATAQVLLQTTLIVWDKCTMAHRAAHEALNRSLSVIRNNTAIMGVG